MSRARHPTWTRTWACTAEPVADAIVAVTPAGENLRSCVPSSPRPEITTVTRPPTATRSGRIEVSWGGASSTSKARPKAALSSLARGVVTTKLWGPPGTVASMAKLNFTWSAAAVVFDATMPRWSKETDDAPSRP